MGFALEYVFLIGEKRKRHRTDPRKYRTERNGKFALPQKIHWYQLGYHRNQCCQCAIKTIQQPFFVLKINRLDGFWHMPNHPQNQSVHGRICTPF
jgi:hypothetical protein